MKALIFAVTTLLLSMIASAQTLAPLRCEAQLGDASAIELQPVSPLETYMTEGVLSGLAISTYQNEDGLTFAVEVVDAATGAHYGGAQAENIGESVSVSTPQGIVSVVCR